MHFGTIRISDIANGVGVRTSLFVSGCRHHCKGCFNPETWDFSFGDEFTTDTENSILAHLSQPWIRGLSILGGEPFEPENQPSVLRLVERVRNDYPDKDIWIYSGFTFEALYDGVGTMSREILSHIDVLVDGRFDIDRKDITLRFRGSSNQRIIDVRKTLKSGEVVLYGL